MPPMLMVHSKNPADVIFKDIGMKKPGVIPGFQLFGNRVLVGIYQRPDKTESGLYIPGTTLAEEKYQGKAGLVLMLGHSAFQSDHNFNFGPDKIEVGDWVALKVTDGVAVSINGCPCRVIRDQDIWMKILGPDTVY